MLGFVPTVCNKSLAHRRHPHQERESVFLGSGQSSSVALSMVEHLEAGAGFVCPCGRVEQPYTGNTTK